MNSLVLKHWRCVVRGTTRSGRVLTGSGTRGDGRGVFLFFAIMPLGAPLFGLVRATALALRAPRDATDVLRRVPAAALRPVRFFGSRRAFPATARAWMFTLLYGDSSKNRPEKICSPPGASRASCCRRYITRWAGKSIVCGTAKRKFRPEIRQIPVMG